jgi:hypothetical protein
MVADIIEIFTDALSGMVDAVASTLITAFDTLVYNSTDGLSGIATWGLVFGGVALVLGLTQRFVK